MTMPKKGTRQIVVEGSTYRYRIKLGPDEHCYGKLARDRILTVESPDGKIHQQTFEGKGIGNKGMAIQPSHVEAYIRGFIINQ